MYHLSHNEQDPEQPLTDVASARLSGGVRMGGRNPDCQAKWEMMIVMMKRRKKGEEDDEGNL